MTTWGIASTILAPAEDILRFVAYHLELGAHRIYIYLDAENPAAFEALDAHPKVRVRTCDAAYWKSINGKRPLKHQPRQTMNATHAYGRRTEVDWLIHMDVDEFLVPMRAVDQVLARVPDDTPTMRCRPMEALGGGDGTAFKAYIPAGRARTDLVQALYPNFGMQLRGGFMSHLLGKVFSRTGLPDIEVRIHQVFQNGDPINGGGEMVQVDLAHVHAKSWEAWRKSFDYRLALGSYRPEVKAWQPAEEGGMTIHEVLNFIQADSGDEGLRAFYDEVIGDSPEMREKLSKHGLLRHVSLDLDTALARQFPDWTPV